MTKTNKKESFSQKFIRLVVRADFKANDSILPSSFPSLKLISPKDYIEGSRLARFGERLWAVLAFMIFSICFLAIVVGWRAVYEAITVATGWRPYLLAVGVISLFLFSLYVALMLSGYLRWMSKKWRK